MESFNLVEGTVSDPLISGAVSLTNSSSSLGLGALEEFSTFHGDSSNLLQEAVAIATEDLVQFQADPEFFNHLTTAFGEDILLEEAVDAVTDIITGEADVSLEVIDDDELIAGFASSNSTIYLSEDFLEQNEANPENVANVLLEEWGHYLDSVLNDTDSVGDEGEIFAGLVKGFNIDIDALQTEDDTSVVNINGEDLVVEEYTGRIPLTTDWVGFQHTSGNRLWFRRDSGANTSYVDIFLNNTLYDKYPPGTTVYGSQFYVGTQTELFDLRPNVLNGGQMEFRTIIEPVLHVNAPQWIRFQ